MTNPQFDTALTPSDTQRMDQTASRLEPLPALLVAVETVSDEGLPSDSDGDEWGEDEIDGETVWSRTVYTCPHCGLKITDDGSDTLMDPTGDMGNNWPVLRGPYIPGKTYTWKHLPCGQMVTWTPIAAQIELGQK